ncbi:MAG TPA: hypothetical protein VHS74_02800, partial [Solirubrobacterales bacterium]|nr:hypothetical protein [Solirubrobacterales bacterium]
LDFLAHELHSEGHRTAPSQLSLGSNRRGFLRRPDLESLEADLAPLQQKLMGHGDEPFRPSQLRDGF